MTNHGSADTVFPASIVTFRRAESNLFDDEVVHLVDNSYEDVIRSLHDGFARFRKPGALRQPVAPPLEPSLYQRDWDRTNARLVGVTWDTMDLDTAAFLIGYGGCLDKTERYAVLPFFFEILLRAKSWVWPFDLVVPPLRRKAMVHFEYDAIHAEPELRTLVHAALRAVEIKYSDDDEFMSINSATAVNRAIRDWAPQPETPARHAPWGQAPRWLSTRPWARG